MKKIINPWSHIDGYHCYGCDPNHQHGLKMEFYEDGEEIVSIWNPTSEHQSWLNTLHGGIQATLLDELCGWVTLRRFQTASVTSKMELRYRKPVHTNQGSLTLRASVVEVRRNLVTVEGRLYNAENELCTECSCLYFLYPQSVAQQMGMKGCYVEGEDNAK